LIAIRCSCHFEAPLRARSTVPPHSDVPLLRIDVVRIATVAAFPDWSVTRAWWKMICLSPLCCLWKAV
jgi:hypothetical protein